MLIRMMGNVAHLLYPRTRERATTVEGSAGVPPAATRHQQMGRIAHLSALLGRRNPLCPAVSMPMPSCLIWKRDDIHQAFMNNGCLLICRCRLVNGCFDSDKFNLIPALAHPDHSPQSTQRSQRCDRKEPKLVPLMIEQPRFLSPTPGRGGAPNCGDA